MEATTVQDTVLAERRGAVLLLTLNRPDRLNAWTDALEDRYYGLLEEADADPEVRAIVVTGAGRGFCAGADMELLQQIGGPGDERQAVERPKPRSYPLTIRKPLIAAINGAAAGLGLVEALYCDVRFATPAAKFTTAFVRRGLIAEYGIAWLLPRIAGPSRALDLLLSGRVVLGEEAYRLGLVDRLCEPDALVDEAVAYAQELATHSSPASMAVIKEQVHAAMDATFQEAFTESERQMAASFGRPDVQEGVASYVEQRPPSFPPLTPRS
jgi:enoyl-CoA hydratase/carnithine racemase